MREDKFIDPLMSFPRFSFYLLSPDLHTFRATLENDMIVDHMQQKVVC